MKGPLVVKLFEFNQNLEVIMSFIIVMQASCTESNVDVVYSSVVFNKPKGLQKVNIKKTESLTDCHVL